MLVQYEFERSQGLLELFLSLLDEQRPGPPISDLKSPLQSAFIGTQYQKFHRLYTTIFSISVYPVTRIILQSASLFFLTMNIAKVMLNGEMGSQIK